jgi:hypothetical protein
MAKRKVRRRKNKEIEESEDRKGIIPLGKFFPNTQEYNSRLMFSPAVPA